MEWLSGAIGRDEGVLCLHGFEMRTLRSAAVDYDICNNVVRYRCLCTPVARKCVVLVRFWLLVVVHRRTLILECVLQPPSQAVRDGLPYLTRIISSYYQPHHGQY